MGKPNGSPQMMGKPNGTSSIHHFSHPHPLELHVFNAQQPAMNVMGSCSSCKLNASGTFYVCKPCNYILHISCSQMAQRITHPADPHHTLSLLPVPVYPEGRFNCDACGLSGNGFSYHCDVCEMDIHTLCAVKPLSISHQSHHHPLTLNFSPPYQGKSFTCDICHQLGSNHWLYRCNSCEFDAHLSCARTKPKTPPQTTDQTRPIHQQTAQRTPFPQPTQTQPIYQHTKVHTTATPHNYGAAGPHYHNYGAVSSPIQNVITGIAQQLSKTVMQDFTGGQEGQTQTRPIYQETVHRPAVPHHNHGSHFTWREGGNEYGNPVDQATFTWREGGDKDGKPVDQVTFTWREGGDEYGNPNGDAGPDQNSEQETSDFGGSCYEENIDISGSADGVAFDLSLNVGNTDGGSADSSDLQWDPSYGFRYPDPAE